MDTYLSEAASIWGVTSHPSISIEALPHDERGVFCKGETPIPSNAVLFSLPFESILTVVSVPKSAVYREVLVHCVEPPGGLREDDVLALLLLHERHVVGAASKWARHIAVLPQTYHSVPNFSAAQLELIRGSNLHTVGCAWQQQLRDDFDALRAAPLRRGDQPPPVVAAATTLGEACVGWLTYESYLWALSTIFSRFITVTTAAHGQVRGMVPVVDLLNHDPTSQVGHVYSDADGIFRVVTQQPWAPGHEICLNYGHVSNARLLMLYGFALPDNPYASIEVYASMSPSAPQSKVDALARMGISTPAPFQVSATALPTPLLAFLRVQHATDEESANVAALTVAAARPLSAETEQRACEALRSALQTMRDAYPDPIEDDERMLLLGYGALGTVERAAVVFRLSEKRVIASALRLLDEHMQTACTMPDK
jgi:histone-lysine N-methyltransferase SETD3